jgi:hypothetical protein
MTPLRYAKNHGRCGINKSTEVYKKHAWIESPAFCCVVIFRCAFWSRVPYVLILLEKIRENPSTPNGSERLLVLKKYGTNHSHSCLELSITMTVMCCHAMHRFQNFFLGFFLIYLLCFCQLLFYLIC